MNRAFNVAFGVVLIATVWLWMLTSLDTDAMSWWVVAQFVGRTITACFITAPVYREYLR